MKIVEPSLLVVHIATIAQRIEFSQVSLHGDDVSPGVIGVLCASASVCLLQAGYIALQVGDVVVDGPVVGHGQRSSAGIIAEIQNIVAHRHPHQIITGVDVSVGLFVADPLGALAAGIVFHGPVQDIQFDRGNPSTGHFSRGVGNEAAILSAVAFSGHLYPQGAGGCVTAGQVLKRACSRSAAQPLEG